MACSPRSRHQDRLNHVYVRALKMKQFSFQKGATDDERIAAFVAFAGKALKINIANIQQLTASRLDDLEKYLSGLASAA